MFDTTKFDCISKVFKIYLNTLAFFQDFFQGGGHSQNFFGGAPSKFSRENDSGRGNIFSKKMKFSH